MICVKIGTCGLVRRMDCLSGTKKKSLIEIQSKINLIVIDVDTIHSVRYIGFFGQIMKNILYSSELFR